MAGIAAGLAASAAGAAYAETGPGTGGGQDARADKQMHVSVTPRVVEAGGTLTFRTYTTANYDKHQFCVQHGTGKPGHRVYKNVACGWSVYQGHRVPPLATIKVRTERTLGAETFRTVVYHGTRVWGVSAPVTVTVKRPAADTVTLWGPDDLGWKAKHGRKFPLVAGIGANRPNEVCLQLWKHGRFATVDCAKAHSTKMDYEAGFWFITKQPKILKFRAVEYRAGYPVGVSKVITLRVS